MSTDVKLGKIRDDYANGVIDEAKFMTEVNTTLKNLHNSMTDAEKIAGFDKILNQVIGSFTITDMYEGHLPTDDELVYVDGDDVHYMYETAVESTLGKKFFRLFYNRVYISG